MTNFLPLTRRINLNNKQDYQDLINILSSIPNFAANINNIKQALHTINDFLSEEWQRIAPPGFIVLDVGKRANVGLNFVDDLLPLGFSLLSLRNMNNIDRIFNKLNSRTHDRLSAIIESVFAAKYLNKGFQVVLEPKIDRIGFSDFKVRFKDEWIYFECKTGSFMDSHSFSINMNNSLMIIKEIKSLLISYDRYFQINIMRNRILKAKDVDNLKKVIIESINSKLFNIEILKYDLVVKISLLSNAQQRDSIVSVFPKSNTLSEQRRINHVISKAISQIPHNSKGIIIIYTTDITLAKIVITKKLSCSNLMNIIAFIIISFGRGSVIVNPINQNYPKEITNIAITNALPSFFC